MARTGRLNARFEEDDLERWKKAAEKSKPKLSLTQWIEFVCNKVCPKTKKKF